jgi:hypothetical protein
MEPTQAQSIDLVPVSGQEIEYGDRMQSPERCVLNKRQDDGWCLEL